MVAKGEFRLPTGKHPMQPENLKKTLPPTHHQKIYFLGEQTEN
jgi:hypothetical protein